MARLSLYSLDGDYIPVSLVKEYAWCPAFAWFLWNGPPEPLPGHIVVEQRLDPLEAATMLEALGHPGPIIGEARLRSESLRVSGVVDYLAEPLEDSPGAVVEFKARGPWDGHEIVQTALYAIAAEEEYRAPFKAYLVSKTSVQEATRRDQAKAIDLLARLRRDVNKPKPPSPGHDMRRCRSCPYKTICPYPGSSRERGLA
jgi:CRISPR-associated protein Cas4